MIGIDLFAGAGGMSLGAAAAGIDVALAVEADPHAAITYAHNHDGAKLFDRDVRELTRSRLRRIKRGKNGTIVFGGPPCQGFSYSNQRTRTVKNPVNWLFLEFIRVVREWEPDWVVFENVKGIGNTEGGVFLNGVLEELGKLKYTATHAVLDAVDFGVPQHRERLFVVAARGGYKPKLPEKMTMKPVSVKQAIDDLPVLSNGASTSVLPYRCTDCSEYARKLRSRRVKSANHLVTQNAEHVVERYDYIPQGGNWENIPERLMQNYADRTRCHTGIYHRLKNTLPSIVIGNFRKNMLIHPKQNRGLSVREAARIQSFPDWFEFQGSVGFQQQQVGNAVPPLLAEAVFRSVLSQAGTSSPEELGAGDPTA